MPYEVLVTARARRDLERLPERVVPAVIEFMFGDLATSPYRVGKPLKRQLEGNHGARRGSYRVLYRIDDDSARVIVLRVAHRSEVYRLG